MGTWREDSESCNPSSQSSRTPSRPSKRSSMSEVWARNELLHQVNRSDRLREYRANLVVFPRNAKAAKKGWKTDASAEETAVATQFVGKVVMKKGASESKVETMKITSEMKEANVARTLKAAWNDARLCGFREKRAAERAEKAAQEALKKSK